jgi:transmembrane sensor
MWRKAGALSADPEIRAAADEALRRRRNRERRAPPTRIGPTRLSIGLAGLALAGGLAAWAVLRAQPDYTTGVGEQRLVLLADGSRVRLNTDTALRVNFRNDVRRVTLLRGEALFEAAHDAARPFIVTANGAEVRAIGTKFDVRRGPEDVRVTLLEGRVQVASKAAAPALLQPNQQLTVSRHGVSAPRPTDASEAAGWTTGRLTFRAVPLAEAVAEVNRYSRRKIVLAGGPELARRPVSGVFDTGDTAAFVSAVQVLFDLRTAPGSSDAIRLTPAQPAAHG